MKKRTFLKLSTSVVAGAVLTPLSGCEKKERLKNWAGNLEYSTDSVYYPSTVEQVQELVKKHDKLRPLGTRHCFNKIADSTENQISSKSLEKVVSLNPETKQVTVESGIRYGTLGEYLQGKGFALHNLASLPHISVAGSCATATHGSGIKNGNLSSAVSAIEFVTAAGDVVNLSREKDGDQFLGAVVNLGALGFVTKTTLDVQPTYQVRQDVYENLPFGELEKNFEAIMSSGYSVSLFTDWQNNNVSEVWVKSRTVEGAPFNAKPEFYGAKLATKNLHPIASLGAENCTEQMGVPGPWHERLPHFRMNFTPSSGKELQSEFFVPLRNAYEALKAINGMGDKWFQDLFISEVRTIDADQLWMSPCYKQASVAIHFTWKQNPDTVMKLIPVVEEQLAPYGARPHWGKLFTISPTQLRSRYERAADFQELVRRYDPKGKFRNQFIETNLFSS
jgi:alditol oxidase